MDLDELAAAWRDRLTRRRAEHLERAEAARRAARQAAAVLRREFGVEEVWLFGSLASEPKHEAFDIDLAVRGLRADRYFHALSRVAEVLGRPVDLVTLETCSERLRRAVAASSERIDDGQRQTAPACG
ncbi:MAG: nucleotidyltransferase domain-containing protein [Candidatus Latescibacterota bacterium]